MKVGFASSICFDSRKVQKGSVFIATQGSEHDGHNFILEAIRRGATTVVHDKDVEHKNPNVEYIKVEDSRKTLAEIAQEFYGHPSRKLKLIGVTGTNGKTTTATLLFHLFKNLGYHCALISTIENRIDDEILPATHTTPDPVALGAFLEQAVKAQCTYVFMECSSHAIDQKRVWGLEFAGVIFTNLTRDHLDYHKTMEAYAESKKALFDYLKPEAIALINQDDEWGNYMIRDTKAQRHFFSLKDKQLIKTIEGVTISWEGRSIRTRLIGSYNAYNILGIYSMATLLKEDEDKVREALESLDAPRGRLEFIRSSDDVYGVVDYAHTPDALENVLKTLREIILPNSKIITVVGCGGDRDKTKRPIMGSIALELSDYTVFTSDNPRTEDPQKILDEVTQNLSTLRKKYECELDRSKAISIATNIARKEDIVLIAGKGHENYQILGEEKIHFSDKEELERIFLK